MRGVTHVKVFVKLVQHQTHTVHQTVHIRRFPLRISRSPMCRQRRLERFEIGHPVKCKVVRLYVDLVEHKNEREFCFVQNAARTRIIDMSITRSYIDTFETTHLQAYNMLDMKVAGAVVLGVSMT